jgi:hypothetical protein
MLWFVGGIAQLVERRPCNWVVAFAGWKLSLLSGNDSTLYPNQWLTSFQKWKGGLEHAIQNSASCLKVCDQECRKGKMGTWLDPWRVVHGLWLELAALLGLSHLQSLGKRIELVLANSLIYYLSSSLRAQVAIIRSELPWTDPIITNPQKLRDHPSGPTFLWLAQGHRPTIEPMTIGHAQWGSERGF